MRALGIDIGTTTVSTVILNGEKAVEKAKTVSNTSFIHTGNEWERIQNVDVIMETVFSVIDEMQSLYPDITSIGLTGQMHGILYYDKDGKCVSPLYTWQDGRGDLAGEDGKSLVREIRETCGLRAASGYGLVTHIYNRRHGLVPPEAAGLCTIGDYLGMQLTSRKRPLMHSSIAASIGFYDPEKAAFNTEALCKMGMEEDLSLLPEITETFDTAGTYRGIRVCVCLGDNQASFLGSVGADGDAILVNMGTGGQISVLSDQYFTAPLIEARPFLPGKYLLAGSSLCGGRAYAILEHFFREYARLLGCDDVPRYDILGVLAAQGAQMADPLTAVTTFKGTREDPGVRGSFANITEDNFTPASLTYAVLRGMAGELFEMYTTISSGTGITAKALVASGNGLRKNEVLRSIFSGLFNAPLTLAPYEEEAACGAAISSM